MRRQVTITITYIDSPKNEHGLSEEDHVIAHIIDQVCENALDTMKVEVACGVDIHEVSE